VIETPAQDIITAYGLDAVCQDIADRKSLTAIAQFLGVSIGTLSTWIDRDPERSARVREARKATARLWDEQAENVLKEAGEDFDLKKAKELAHHYRWRASKIAPAEYGDRLQHANDPDNPLVPAQVTDADLDARIQALMGKGTP